MVVSVELLCSGWWKSPGSHVSDSDTEHAMFEASQKAADIAHNLNQAQ